MLLRTKLNFFAVILSDRASAEVDARESKDLRLLFLSRLAEPRSEMLSTQAVTMFPMVPR
jgi:hypothetical protein